MSDLRNHNYRASHRAQVELSFVRHNRVLGSDRWFRWFREEVVKLNQRWIDSDGTLLDVGCGDGALMEAAGCPFAVGIDANSLALNRAQLRSIEGEIRQGWFEDSEFPSGTSFDTIVMCGLLEQVYDVSEIFDLAAKLCNRKSRLVITTYSRLGQVLLGALEFFRLRERRTVENWIPPVEVLNLLQQSGFEVVQHERRIMFPFHVPLLSKVANQYLSTLPLLRHLCLVNVMIARRPEPITAHVEPSVSVVVAARNESGNISQLLDRVPKLSSQQEIIFVEGGSRDGTFERICEEIETRRNDGYPFKLSLFRQPGEGKGDAIRLGFSEATGELLIILDADLSVPPEELPRFVNALSAGFCDFANGSRLVYSMDQRAMQFLNLFANKLFGVLFSFLLGQPVRDTLCGTKALWAEDYRKIAANRSRFGDFDPFGDFDLLFGAANLGLRIRDVPVHYKERTYGSTNISRFRHGALLLRMSWIAARKLRFV